jgi:hypothetical protein
VIIDDLDKVIRICDSGQTCRSNSDSLASLAAQLKQVCRFGTKDEFTDLESYDIQLENVWKQPDTNSCGIAVIANALAASKGEPYPSWVNVYEMHLWSAMMVGKGVWSAYLVKKAYELGGNELVMELGTFA